MKNSFRNYLIFERKKNYFSQNLKNKLWVRLDTTENTVTK